MSVARVVGSIYRERLLLSLSAGKAAIMHLLGLLAYSTMGTINRILTYRLFAARVVAQVYARRQMPPPRCAARVPIYPGYG